jgi:thiol:disulfide interchange protein DsbC
MRKSFLEGRMRIVLVAVLTMLMLNTGVHAQSGTEQKIAAVLHKLFPDLEVTRVRKSRIPGLYEALLGTEVYYVSADGKYLLRGDLYDLKDKKNLTEEQRAAARIKVLRKIPSSEYIEFAPAHPKHTIYVFTDVTCPFCRKLHSEIAQLNKGGLAVRYLAFPRNGIKSAAYHEMVSIWCAKDRQSALTAAKLGHHIQSRQCDNPVKKQYNLGQSMGVHGTPTIYTEDGSVIGGYKPAAELLKVVDRH